jgi:acylphosphatase
MPLARSVRIAGHVQAVFFREWTVNLANRLGVNGWVRNRNDGSLEVYAVGNPEQLEKFISELREGSPASRVDNVSVEPADVERVAGFMRRSTL